MRDEWWMRTTTITWCGEVLAHVVICEQGCVPSPLTILKSTVKDVVKYFLSNWFLTAFNQFRFFSFSFLTLHINIKCLLLLLVIFYSISITFLFFLVKISVVEKFNKIEGPLKVHLKMLINKCNMFAQVFVCAVVCLCENKSAILLDSIPQTYKETNKPTNLNRNTNSAWKSTISYLSCGHMNKWTISKWKQCRKVEVSRCWDAAVLILSWIRLYDVTYVITCLRVQISLGYI